ncbi:hypothetical protein GCM10027599_26670 [Yimella radicis]
MSEPTRFADEPMFTLAFVLAANEAGYERGLREGLHRADAASHDEFEAARAVVHSAAGGDRHELFDRLGVDTIRDPWAEVAERLEQARETQRRAVHDSLRGGAA